EMRSQALRGALQLIDADRTKSEDEKLEILNVLLGDTRDDKEKDLVISGYGEIDTLACLEKLVRLMRELGSRPELENSIREITRNVYISESEKTRDLILQAQSLSSNEEFRQWIDDGLKHERFGY
ncbi:MAG: hypothetical protein KJT03_23695, partial [Verrucomicrobiae bacterium]|nr:hypothetical protein [Verrucomicrobiae bacterium]